MRILNSDEMGAKGELEFEQLCVSAKLIANKSTRDRTGWDYIVEFPNEPNSSERLDDRPARAEIKAQIKTVKITTNSIRLRLSAAERLAKYPQASFIFVLTMAEDQRFKEIFVIHVMDEILEQILKSLRINEERNALNINQKYINIDFRKFGKAIPVDHENLRNSIEFCCGPNVKKYIENKHHQLESLGYGEFRYTGKITILADSPDEMLDVMLGVKPARITDFTMQEIRWGISLPTMPTFTEGTVKFLPKPMNSKIQLRNKAESLNLQAKALLPAAKVLLPEFQRARISNDIIQIDVDMHLGKLEIKIGPDDNTRLTIRQYLQFNKMQRMLITPGTIMKISIKDHELIKGEYTIDNASFGFNSLEDGRRIFLCLDDITNLAGNSEIFIDSETIKGAAEAILFLHRSAVKNEQCQIIINITNIERIRDYDQHDCYVVGMIYLGEHMIIYGMTGRISISSESQSNEVTISNLRTRALDIMEFSQENADIFSEDFRLETDLSLGFHIDNKILNSRAPS
jgi:hypothetical protein